jgi:hypothetical protein
MAQVGWQGAAGQTFLVGGFNLCLDHPGTVSITDVQVEVPRRFVDGPVGKLEVRSFAVRSYFDHPLQHGPELGTLAAFGSGFDVGGPHVVSGVCPNPDDLANWQPKAGDGIVELAIEVARTTADADGGPVLDITYRDGDRSDAYRLHYALLECVSASTCPQVDPMANG